MKVLWQIYGTLFEEFEFEIWGKKTTVRGGSVAGPFSVNPFLGKRGVTGRIHEVNRGFANGPRRKEHGKSYGKAIDPVLGFNLEGGFLCDGAKQVSSLTDQGRYAMDHDLEDVALVGEEGKKRSRGENDDLSKKEKINSP
ncbi:hypothetical protein Goari_025331, partial [Gossypium aridum]|nr:hypothetical protein [Gossypium aridum]